MRSSSQPVPVPRPTESQPRCPPVPGYLVVAEGSADSSVEWSGSAGTAPHLVLAETSESASMVGGVVCSAGSAPPTDGDMATSFEGPRKRGVKR
ncbi:hypothetical protein BS78_08G031000 [Paspalum vaginatum]|nr:hypothetical protein BS78_08G031000 [Paspalum vaginatum]